MKKLTFMFVMLFMAVASFAQNDNVVVSWTASSAGLANAAEILEPISLDDNITATFSAGTYESSAKYYDNGTHIRFYAGNQLTIQGGNILKIVFTLASGYNPTLAADGGTLEGDTWEGQANSVTFTNTASKQTRITGLTVTYMKPAEGVFGHVNITPAEGEVESLGHFVIDFSDLYNEGKDVRGVFGDIEDPYIIANNDESTKKTALLNDKWDGTFELDFDDITDPGSYQLVVPAGSIEVDYEPNPQMTFNYTIKGVETVDPLTLLEVSPAQGKVEAISTIELTFGDLELSVREDADIVLKKDGEEHAYFFGYTDEEENKIAFFEDVDGGRFTDAGNYELVIPAGTITAGGQAVGEITLSYEIKGQQVLTGNPFTWKASEQGYENAEDLGEVALIDGFKMTFSKGENNIGPKYYNTGESVRMYKNNTLTLEGKDITKVVFTFLSGYAGAVVADPEGVAQNDDENTLTWQGKADKIVFTNAPAENSQFRFTKMEVTYDEGTDTPTLTVDQIVEMASITPATGTVEKLEEFQLTFGELALTAKEDADVTLTRENSEDVVANGMMEVAEDGKTINVVLESTITTAGVYQLNIPANAITADGVSITLPLSFKYTIQGNDFYEGITINPAEGEVESLSTFTITFPAMVGEINNGAQAVLTNTTTGDSYNMEMTDAGTSVIVYGLSDDVTAPGEYTLDIPQNGIIFYNQGADFVLNALQFHYTIAGGNDEPQVVTLPEGLDEETWYLNALAISSDFNIITIEHPVGVAMDYEAMDVYVKGMNRNMPNAWIKGAYDFSASTITFKGGQFYGYYEDDEEFPLYFGAKSETGELADAVFSFDLLEGKMTYDGVIVLNSNPNTLDKEPLDLEYMNVSISSTPPVDKVLVTLPENVTPELYNFTAYNAQYETDDKGEVYVGFDGSDVYIQGLSKDYIPDAWVKGTLTDNVLSIPQTYLGEIDYFGMMQFSLILNACTFTYDPETSTFTSEEGYSTGAGGSGEADVYTNVVITKATDVVPLTPATPTITDFSYSPSYGYSVKMDIPTTSVEGEELMTSMLSYQLFYEVGGQQHPFVFTTDNYTQLTENMETIPYNFSDNYDIGKNGYQVYLNASDVDTWDKVGVKSIYTAGGETRESETFWYTIKSGTEPAVIEDGEYINEYTDLDGNAASGYVNIRVDGDKVYVSGISRYLPDNEIVGTLDGNTVTFAAQTVGSYAGYFNVYFLQNETVTFTYDAEAQKFTSADEVYTWYQYSGNAYYDACYKAPVWKKVKEVAGTPATPAITNLYESQQGYGWIIRFSVPTVDTEGNGMVGDKLSYQFFTDINHDVQPLVFKADNHDYLNEDMTVVPFTFTDQYDFESGMIYLNADYSDAWNKLGIQSIYTGGGETHKSEIFWYDIKDYISSGISGIGMDEEGTNYFDALGRRTSSDAKGLVIKQVRTADGVKTVKMVRK